MNGLRDPQASDALNPNPGGELDRVIRASVADSEMLGNAVKFLTYTGAHISVLTGGWRRETASNGALREWYVDPIDSHAIRGDNIYWRRPKNKKPIPMYLSRHLRGWLPGWLDQPRPYDPSRYNQLLNRVGRAVGIHLNPLRFRHTCGVLLFHVHKQPASVVELLLGVSPQVVSTYIAKPPWAIAEELRASGF